MVLIQVPTLETERLRLRAFSASDIDDYAALNADPRVLRYLGFSREPWDRGRSWRHMAFMVGHWQLAGTGSWAVEYKETGAFVGVIGYSEPEGWPDLELAWKLVPLWWGYGYATEGARAALDYAFSVWKRERVISLICPDNLASIRVAERIGVRPQGRTTLAGTEFLLYDMDRERYREMEAPALALTCEALG